MDAMGGDLAPKVNIKGAIAAAQQTSARIVLVGDEKKILPLLAAEKKKNPIADSITVHHTADFIEMGDHPAQAVRSKKEASLNVAMRLAAADPQGAFLSAGNSGAALASAIMHMKRIPGVERPAIAAPLPTTRGFMLLLDAGANVVCKPIHLVQFALLGSAYFRELFPGRSGNFGILSNGAEETKGTDLTRETHAALQALVEKGVIPAEQYAGYVEGARLFHGHVDVVVCDGFTGNLVLKSLEGLSRAIIDMMKMEFKKDWLAIIGAFLAKRALKNMRKRTDYAEIGCAPLIGVNGFAFIAHGRSNPKAITNAIIRCANSVHPELTQKIAQQISEADQIIAVAEKKAAQETS